MMKMDLTIFTPTYNRGYTLHKLYKSLCGQTNKNFIWLVVDDGSIDNTKEMIREWIDEGLIIIKYIYQSNQGKHIAHNTGVEHCDTELFFCVDSDDYLLDNAIEDILSDRKQLMNDYVSGIVAVRVDEDRKPLVKEMPESIEYCSLSDLYEKYRFKGDTALVLKTELLRKIKFPKIEGEKFIGEEYVYAQLDQAYKLFVSTKKFYVCKYLSDGYTKNIYKLIASNPRGYMLLKKMKLKSSRRLRSKYKAAALYIVGGWLSKEEGVLRKSPNRIITLLAFPLAMIVYIIRFKHIKLS